MEPTRCNTLEINGYTSQINLKPKKKNHKSGENHKNRKKIGKKNQKNQKKRKKERKEKKKKEIKRMLHSVFFPPPAFYSSLFTLPFNLFLLSPYAALMTKVFRLKQRCQVDKQPQTPCCCHFFLLFLHLLFIHFSSSSTRSSLPPPYYYSFSAFLQVSCE